MFKQLVIVFIISMVGLSMVSAIPAKRLSEEVEKAIQDRCDRENIDEECCAVMSASLQELCQQNEECILDIVNKKSDEERSLNKRNPMLFMMAASTLVSWLRH